MEIKVQISVNSEAGQPEVIQQVAHLERGALRPDTLGLSLAEAGSILAGLEQALVEQQTAELLAQAQRCPRCGRVRACKGHHPIVFRTPFGKLTLDSPRLYRCPCESETRKSFSPLAELLCERTSPELLYLQTKFAALVSYGLTVELLKEVLPIGQALNTMSLRRQVQQTAGRLEAELGERQDGFGEDGPKDQAALSASATPFIAGLDGRLRSCQRPALAKGRLVRGDRG